MADTKNSASEDQGADENQNQNQGNEGEENTENTASEGENSGDDNADEGDEGDEGEGDDINEDEEPATRKSSHNAFHAGQRIARKQAKQGNEQKPDEGGEEGDEGEGDDKNNKGGDQKSDPTDIETAVANAIKPFTDKMAEQETKDEVDTYIADNPEFKPYAKKILKFANHPTRRHLPIETVALEAVGRKGLLQIGAKRAQEADAEADQTQSGGTSTRNAPKGKSVNEMSKEEFEAKQNEIRHGKRS